LLGAPECSRRDRAVHLASPLSLALVTGLWYGFGLLVVAVAWDTGLLAHLLDRSRPSTIIGLIWLAGLFGLLPRVLRRALGPFHDPVLAQRGESFPAAVTIVTATWLLVLSVISLLALLWTFSAPPWLGSLPLVFTADATDILVTMLAATVGSLITTILAFLEHASYKGDFKRAFVPWYVARPLMGMLLGVVFFFVLKAGLWTLAGDPPKISLQGLAAIGSLVGLFSKYAIEKLRELFETTFRTEDGVLKDFLERLPEPLRTQVMTTLKPKSAPKTSAQP
jgi:hypothetical protein